MSPKIIYQHDPNPQKHVVREQGIEDGFIEKLRSLKYTDRPDIRDRATLEKNFREKFEALNRVSLTDGEFQHLLEEMLAPYKGRIYDPACGTGGMLTITKDRIQQINPQANVFLYGQELNPQTWAIARSDRLILEPEGKDAENIKLPVCFWFAGRNNSLDPANVTRLFAGETVLSLVA